MAFIKRLKYCINNEWLESATSKYMPVMNPSLGVQIAEAPCCTQSEVDAAVKAAAAAFPAWPSRHAPMGGAHRAKGRRHHANARFPVAPGLF